MSKKVAYYTICYKYNLLIISLYLLCNALLHIATHKVFMCARFIFFLPFLLGISKNNLPLHSKSEEL